MTDAEEVRTRLHWRYATKKFDPARAIPDAEWAVLEESLVLAPSSFGLQPWKFLVVENPNLRAELRKLSWNQAQITDAARLVVFASQRTITSADVDRYIARTCELRQMEPQTLTGYRNVIVGFAEKGWASRDLQAWNTRQVYLALGQFMTAAAMLGVDTCPMEGIDLAGYDRALGLDGTPFTTAVACTAGYRAGDDKYASAVKVRYAASDVLERR